MLPTSEARPDASIEGEDPALVGIDDVEETARCINEDKCDETSSVLLLDEAMSIITEGEQSSLYGPSQSERMVRDG